VGQIEREATTRHARPAYARLQLARLEGSFGHEALSGFGFEREKKGRAMPENFPPEKLPEPWLIDSEYLLRQLASIRELALKVPFTNDSYQPTNTVVDAIWRLEEQLRYLLHLHRDGQRAFAAKADEQMNARDQAETDHEQISARHQAETAALEKNIAARTAFRKSANFLACTKADSLPASSGRAVPRGAAKNAAAPATRARGHRRRS
jgi:hypothetical protein